MGSISPVFFLFFSFFFFSFLLLGSISPVLPFFFSSSSSFTRFNDLGFFFFFPFFFHWVRVIWTFFLPFLLSLVQWSRFVKSWSSSGGYGSNRFDLAAAMAGPFPRCPSSNSSNRSFPMFCSLKTLKPTIATTAATATSTSMAWVDLSLLFFFLFFFFMIEKSGFVLEYIYACLILFWMRNLRWERWKGRKMKNEKRTN